MAHERRLTRLLSGSTLVRGPGGDDEVLAALAAVQHGVVARQQLLELGMSHDAIDYRLACGRLRRSFAGRRAAYAVGHEALSLQGRALAGVIAAGPNAAASHWTKLALHRLIEKPRPLIHLTAPTPRRSRKGLFIHRAIIPSDELEITDGVPTLSLPRTFLDISAEVGDRAMRTLIKRAEFHGLIESQEIVAILDRYPRRRGRKTLARVARGYALASGRTASPLEDDFLEFCVMRDIPPPETNVPIWVGDRERIVDCLWREARVVAELDGRDAHERRLAFEDDRARDRALTAAGWRPVRITSVQLAAERDALERDLLRLVASPGAA